MKENSLKEKNSERRKVIQFLGIEVTAPKGMKNPLFIILSLVIINIIFVYLLSKTF